MKTPLVLVVLLAAFVSCKNERPSTATQERVAELEAQVAQLEMEAALQDSMLNESLTFFGDIQSNLAAIQLKEGEIRTASNNPEQMVETKQEVIQKIREINRLRAENQQKIATLERQLDGSNAQMGSLRSLIENLKKEVAMRDEQIATLQDLISKKDVDYATLFDAYQSKEFAYTESENERYKAYFVYGTAEELQKYGVVEVKNGIIGIGRKISLKNELNYQYLTKVDQRDREQFTIIGRKPKIVSSHPTDSYQLTTNNMKSVLQILNPDKFWRNSRFLIVTINK